MGFVAKALEEVAALVRKGLSEDVAEQVADLIRLGFPESTATKIASGELPMDTASRMQRADEQGYDVDTPVYHGTAADVRQLKATGETTKARSAKHSVWLVDDPNVAGTYARYAAESRPVERLIEQADSHGRKGEFDRQEQLYHQAEELESSGELVDAGGQNILQVYANMKNPMRKDADGATMSDLDDSQLFKWLQEGRSNNNDGLIIDNFSDNADYGQYLPAKHLAVQPDQVRSVNAAFDPDYKGPNILGGYALPAGSTALMASLLAAPEEAEAGFVTRGGRELLEAWHGSPHEFDRFSMDAIGTGEGAQAYGHGLYFADSKDVATGYRDNLKDWDSVFEMNNRLDELQSEIDSASGEKLKKLVSEYEQVAEAREIAISDPGALYRTEIDVTPDQLLDYDKPLSEQGEAVRNGVTSTEYYQNLRSNMLGSSDDYVDSVDKILSESTYDDLIGHSSNYDGENASLFSSQLSENNVKGIKYLDGDSRGKFDDGTSNYVIFDDKLINIAERGASTPGMMALLAAGGAGATAAGSESNAVTEATSRIVNHMLDNVTEVTDLLEIPQRGIQGLLRAGYGLMQGDGLDASLNAGADVVNQGVEATAKQAGDAMLEKTGSPELATMAYTAVMLGSPL